MGALVLAPLTASTGSLVDEWRGIAAETDGVVGVCARHLGSGRSFSLRGRERFPLASVCKLPIAAHILGMVSEGKLSLGGEIEIPVYDVYPGVSEIAERWAGQKRFTLDEILLLMVAKSDNTAVQTLWRTGGGAPGMAARLRQWGIAGMRLDRSERRCGLDAAGVRNPPPETEFTPGLADQLTARIPEVQRLAAMRRFIADPRDTGTPDDTVLLLEKAARGELLPAPLTARLMGLLEATSTGPARIKGFLPAGTVVAHKTGTTGTASGLNGSTNDAGIVTLPGGAGKLALAVYLKGSTRDQASRERTIARIAKASFDWARSLG